MPFFDAANLRLCALAVRKVGDRGRRVADTVADQLGTGRILTLDSDFEIYRWRSRRKFELMIDLR